MQLQLKTWGNSQGFRIPKEILQAANLSINDTLEVKVSQGKIILFKPFHHQTLEERAAAFGNSLQLDGEYSWGDPVGREVW